MELITSAMYENLIKFAYWILRDDNDTSKSSMQFYQCSFLTVALNNHDDLHRIYGSEVRAPLCWRFAKMLAWDTLFQNSLKVNMGDTKITDCLKKVQVGRLKGKSNTNILPCVAWQKNMKGLVKLSTLLQTTECNRQPT